WGRAPFPQRRWSLERLKNVRVCVGLLSPTDILRSGKNSGYMPRPFTRYVLHKGDITCVPTTITVSSNIL
ncbi:MAG: hypothetical protein RR326_14920, partial [Stenotrophomonas sp.]